MGKEYASSLIRREDLLDRDGEEGGRGVKGDEEKDSADEDPFGPTSDGSEQDPFTKCGSSGSESLGTPSDEEYAKGRNKVKVSALEPEDEGEEVDSDEAFGEVDVISSRGKTEIVNAGDTLVSEDEAEASSRLSEGESEEGASFEINQTKAPSNQSDTSPSTKKADGNRAALKALLSYDTAAVASSLYAAASADAKKGRAVKAQYQTFDRFLDARIKLQKGVTAVNSIIFENDLSEHKDAIKAAEEAALSLWSSINSLRHSFAESRSHDPAPQNKRKRTHSSPATTSTSVSTLWSTTQSLSSTTLPHHRATLEKWSAKMRATNPIAREPRSLLHDTGSQDSITNVIDGYLSAEASKLITQSTNNTTSIPNPLNASRTTQKPTPNPIPRLTLHYDDTPFYQSLLRDLIASRSTTTFSNTSDLSTTLPLSTTTKLHQKSVDTKASKGRKVRYTIHEKVQNFMAAEGTAGSGWSEEARDEFFGSLMGGRRVLDEDVAMELGSRDEEEGVENREGEALRLFRSH